jgi:glycine dehydrogenase
MQASALLGPSDTFVSRHIGPSEDEIQAMLAVVGASSLDALIDQSIPRSIRTQKPLSIGPARGEHELLQELQRMAKKNRVQRSMIGMGYYDCIVPGVVQRNVLENPGWYTQYTPYQAEISQGRMEALVNFQTMIADLTGLPLANASLLDEATAAAEAMSMCVGITGRKKRGFFVERRTHPQTIEVIRTRAEPIGVTVHVGDVDQIDFAKQDLFGVLVQYPNTEGAILDYAALATKTHDHGALFVCATDLLALVLLEPPGELGADIAIGSAQRFGVPLGGGGPHAAFISTKDEHKRFLPGRIIGVSRDSRGKPAYRLSLQTREQHIRRDKATSNICTAQVLLAVMASMYAVYHGPEGLKRIARRVHALTNVLREGLSRLGHGVGNAPVFDTLRIAPQQKQDFAGAAEAAGYNLRRYDGGDVGISLDETSTLQDVQAILDVFGKGGDARALADKIEVAVPERFRRKSDFLTHPIFNSFHAEHEMLRYIKRLESKDLSLTTSMIPLGSCTMKLNGTTEMKPVTWAEFGGIHPFAPREQQQGYQELFASLEKQLMDVTGFPAISLQPNAGSQGEYAGLLVIRAYHHSRGDHHRNVCLIPTSAHGTNPASASMCGMKVVVVSCDDHGNIDLGDLEAKATKHAKELAALMVTYPSTHGVFESGIKRICAIVHEHGGQVYLDGANMNAQVGVCRPAEYGADVVHLNLHKTFCIPHGGGGPGMGPIGVAAHLASFLPGREKGIGAVSAAPYGSPSILTIPWVYISLMGSDGLKRATEVAILAANYMAKRLEGHFEILYTGESGRVAHEFIVDMRPFKRTAGIEVEDIAKRLMDYGFHAPTMSFPVAGTMMIEPTESESKAELDRLCDALIAIRGEIRAIEEGKLDRTINPLTQAPHTIDDVAGAWDRPYSREQAVLPAPWLKKHKFWPAVGRVDNPWGDRNLFCTCPPMESE